MSKLLLDEHPIMVMPQLAKKIGLNESMFLQQVHYWNEINKRSNNNYKDGHHWTFNSINEWQEQFPFWGTRTIQRTITNLEKMKLLITSNYNKLKIDRTKWYRIDYEALEVLENSPFSQIGTKNMTEWLQHLDNMTRPLPETNPEIKSETTPKRYTITSNGDSLFNYYNYMYHNSFGKDHPTVTEKQLKQLEFELNEIEGTLDMTDEEMKDCVDYHFENLPPTNDGKIFSFLDQGVIYRYTEEM